MTLFGAAKTLSAIAPCLTHHLTHDCWDLHKADSLLVVVHLVLTTNPWSRLASN